MSPLVDVGLGLSVPEVAERFGSVGKAVARDRWDRAARELEKLATKDEPGVAEVVTAVEGMMEGVAARIGSRLDAGDFLTAQELVDAHAKLAAVEGFEDRFDGFARRLDEAPDGLVKAQAKLRKRHHSKAISRNPKDFAEHRAKIECLAEGWEWTHVATEVQWEVDWCDARLAELESVGR